MNFTLQKIDTNALPYTSELEAGDDCYFLGDYVCKEYRHPMTSFILDFKSVPEHFRFAYKQGAMRKLANFLQNVNFKNMTIVPVPPSKSMDDPRYDDRLARTLNMVGALSGQALDVQELIVQDQSYPASHDSFKLNRSRPNAHELMARYQLLEKCSHELGNTIVIFDDVITRGSHFKAIQRLINARYPEKAVIGLFIAQTSFRGG